MKSTLVDFKPGNDENVTLGGVKIWDLAGGKNEVYPISLRVDFILDGSQRAEVHRMSAKNEVYPISLGVDFILADSQRDEVHRMSAKNEVYPISLGVDFILADSQRAEAHRMSAKNEVYSITLGGPLVVTEYILLFTFAGPSYGKFITSAGMLSSS